MTQLYDKCMNQASELALANVRTLRSAVDLLETLSTDDYNCVHKPYFDASPGAHVRHVLDHYSCLRRDLSSGRIDYDRRDRNIQLERDCYYAICQTQEICSFLENLDPAFHDDLELNVCLHFDDNSGAEKTTRSSLGRELQFLQSHSVHHYAIIAAMLRSFGKHINTQFGVAPSTLIYERQIEPRLKVNS